MVIPVHLGAQKEDVRRQWDWLYDRFVDNVAYSLLVENWPALQTHRCIEDPFSLLFPEFPA